MAQAATVAGWDSCSQRGDTESGVYLEEGIARGSLEEEENHRATRVGCAGDTRTDNSQALYFS